MRIRRIFLMLFTVISLFLINKSVFALEENGSFTELQQLINDSTTGTVKLEKDYINNGSESQLQITKNLTLDLNGHIINANRHGRVLKISGNVIVTIMDSGKDTIHKFDVDSSILLATLNETNGTTTIKGGCITGGDSDNNGGAGIYVEGSSLIIKAGNIIGNIAADWGYGSGIKLVSNSNVTIDGGKVIYNSTRSEGFGGGIEINSGNLTLKNGIVGYNNSTYAGGISLDDANGKVVMEGGEVVGNYSTHYGGGIGCSEGIVEIKNGVIKENYSRITLLGHGGGIGTDKNGTVIITGGKIINNKATRGGGVGVWRGGTIYIYGGEITGNISVKDDTPYQSWNPGKDLGSGANAGGGVYFNSKYNASYSGTLVNLTIGKDAIIKDNFNDVTKKEDNVYVSNNLKFNIGEGDYVPTNKMKVGISMENNGIFTTNGSTSDTTYFFSDDPNYEPLYESSSLKLGPKEYTYTFIKGDNQKLVKGKIKNYTIEIDGDHTLFDTLEIGDLTLTNNTDYSITRGSTIITFNTEGLNKLNTLDIDTYEVKVKYTNSKEVLGTLTIQKEIVNPKTADNINYYIIIGCLSIIGLIISGLYSVKKKLINKLFQSAKT